MTFIEITDEEALSLPADQLMQIAAYNLMVLDADFTSITIQSTQSHIDKQYNKLMQKVHTQLNLRTMPVSGSTMDSGQVIGDTSSSS